jgi:hypothetical protein
MSLEFMKEVLYNYPSGHEPYKKIILMRIADNAGNDDGLAWTGQKEMAKAAGISIRYVRDFLREMENEGSICTFERFSKDTGNKTSNYYIILFGTTQEKIQNALARMRELGTIPGDVHLEPWTPPEDSVPVVPEVYSSGGAEGSVPVVPEDSVPVVPEVYSSGGAEDSVPEVPEDSVPMNHKYNHKRTIILNHQGSSSAMGPTNMESLHEDESAQSKTTFPERESFPPSGSAPSPQEDGPVSLPDDTRGMSITEIQMFTRKKLKQLEAELDEQGEVYGAQDRIVDFPSNSEPEYVNARRNGGKARGETMLQAAVLRVCKRKYFDFVEQQDQVDEIDRRMQLPILHPDYIPKLFVDEKLEWVREKNRGNAAPIGIKGLITAISNPDNLIKWRNIQSAKKAR